MDNIKKQGEEELKRALLMMKYDNRKTLTENVKVVSEEIPAYPAPKDEPSGKSSVVNTGIKTVQGSTKNVNMWDYVDSNSPTINADLGVDSSQISDFTNKGWSEVDISEVDSDVTENEGLVDSLDFFVEMSNEDINRASGIITKYQSLYVNWNGKYYPAMEAVRAKYSEDEYGDSLRADIWDPAGANTDIVQKFSKDTAAIYDNSYKNWCDILNSLVTKTDTEGDTEGNVDDSGKPAPEPTPPPKPKNNPYKDIEWEDDDSDDSKIEG
jgi:hypothetical protein